METTVRRTAILMLVALLALGITALPAAGKAEDNAEKGRNRGYTPTEGNSADPRSTNAQGSSNNTSNPDGNGVDKPVPATQGESDWDWNNGCGNDDDRDDDNNGWCGRKQENENASVRAAGLRSEDHEARKAAVMAANQNRKTRVLGAGGVAAAGSPGNVQVLGAQFSRGNLTEVLGAAGANTAVLGAGFDAAALPRTGLPALATGLVALALALSGGAILRRGRR